MCVQVHVYVGVWWREGCADSGDRPHKPLCPQALGWWMRCGSCTTPRSTKGYMWGRPTAGDGTLRESAATVENVKRKDGKRGEGDYINSLGFFNAGTLKLFSFLLYRSENSWGLMDLVFDMFDFFIQKFSPYTSWPVSISCFCERMVMILLLASSVLTRHDLSSFT